MKRFDLQITHLVVAGLIIAIFIVGGYNLILWLRGDPDAEPLVALAEITAGILLTVWTWLRQRDTSQTQKPDPNFDITTPRNQQIRATLLDNIQSEIVAGYLQDALQEMFKWLDLGKRYQPEALQRHATYRRPGSPDQPIPPGKPISQLFSESGRALLILGAPGSGKTFTLHELAHDLLAEAHSRPATPVPVILNLASWSLNQLPLLDWLVETLNIEQGMGRDTARTWASRGAFTLLLDGLDEVSDDLRNDCVAAINTFRTQYTVQIAITSRLEEYENLQQQLNLGHAIRLLPLSDTQIFDYLAELGPNFNTIKEALTHDRGLHSLAQAPLMLHIIALAYRDLTPDQLQPLDTIIERRQHLYDTFIQHRLDDFHQTQLATTTYTPAEAMHWLTWLAQRMKALDQTNFYIERLQANWLPHPAQRRRHGWQVGLAVGLAEGLTFGLAIGLAFGPAGGLAGVLAGGLAGGWMLGREAYHSAIPLAETLKLTWPSRSGMLIALASGLALGLVGGLVEGLTIWLAKGLIIGLAFGLALALQAYEITGRTQPNQGIIRSRRTAWQAGLALGLAFGLALGLAFGLAFGLAVGLAFGLTGWVGRGGDAVINHRILCQTLTKENYLPQDLIPYLDHMARLVLLQRVGGGYRFIHLTLRDHLARQHLPPDP